tara:strand:- start:57895 stop:58545 length:651 start_codon:yes stop_codon:yes gene_type:complete
MNLVLFDLDDTLIAGDSETAWSLYIAENLMTDKEKFLKQMSIYSESYRKGILDVSEYSEFLLQPLEGRSVKDIKDMARSWAIKVVDELRDELTDRLINRHIADKKILTSGTLSFLVEEISKELAIPEFFGTEHEEVDGKFTGKVLGNPNFSNEKVLKIQKLYDINSYEKIYSYSDSIYDLPLLEIATIATAVNPDKELRGVAEARGWTIDESRLMP